MNKGHTRDLYDPPPPPPEADREGGCEALGPQGGGLGGERVGGGEAREVRTNGERSDEIVRRGLKVTIELEMRTGVNTKKG